MRRTRLNCSYEPKYTETERKRWDIKEFWNDPKRYLTGVNELPTDEARYRTILDTRYVNPSTRKCKPVAYISRSGMIEYVDESAKIPEAREVINEEAVNRFKNWLQAREKHSVEDNIYNITHATVHGGYAWTRSEALKIEGAVTRALQDGADPQQVVDDYQIVMWLTGLAEKQGYEYPEGAGIDVARATALAHEAINGNKINSNRSFNSARRINSARLNSNSNLMFGALGNGLTVYDTSRQDGNDYLTVAHIDDTGMVKYYVDVTPEERARINKQAASQRKKWLDSWDSRSSSAQYQKLLDKADVTTLKAISDDRKNGRVGVIEDVINKYRDDVFSKPLTKYGYEYPDDVVVNSSRLPAKTQRAIRHCINSARLNSSSNLMFGALGNGLTVYDKSHRDGNDYLEIAHITTSGMIKYYTDVNDEERAAINKRALLMQDEWLNTYGQDYGSTADAQRRLKEAQENAYNAGYEYPDDVTVNSSRRSLKTQRAIRHCINSARRRAALQANRRLNCGYYYDGEDYSEMGYDKEQDAYYDLPDEMYIYKLDLSQFTDLVRDGIVSKREIHEWIDGLSEDWGGMPAWSPAKLIDKFEIQDLTKEQYDTWKANFAEESVRFRDELEGSY